jgi:hypothetical protein
MQQHRPAESSLSICEATLVQFCSAHIDLDQLRAVLCVGAERTPTLPNPNPLPISQRTPVLFADKELTQINASGLPGVIHSLRPFPRAIARRDRPGRAKDVGFPIEAAG